MQIFGEKLQVTEILWKSIFLTGGSSGRIPPEENVGSDWRYADDVKVRIDPVDHQWVAQIFLKENNCFENSFEKKNFFLENFMLKLTSIYFLKKFSH